MCQLCGRLCISIRRCICVDDVHKLLLGLVFHKWFYTLHDMRCWKIPTEYGNIKLRKLCGGYILDRDWRIDVIGVCGVRRGYGIGSNRCLKLDGLFNLSRRLLCVG